MTFLLCVTEVAWSAQENQHLVVIVPQVRAPFDQIFAEILSGIEEVARENADSVKITEDTSTEDVALLLRQQNASSVIALGNQAKNLLKPLEGEFHTIYGAVFINPDDEPNNLEGISLTPSPAATFSWLNKIVANINTVHVVYQNDYSGWLIKLAEKAAPRHSLKLVKHPVSNVREAAAVYRGILETSNPAHDAIWLTQRDPSLDENAVLPDILAQAWSKNFVVFSSNPSHVPRGALFALYPDNHKMGSSLARLALRSEGKGIAPLNDLLIAVNIRTASHIGKNFSRSEEKQFDLVFPNR